MRERELIMSIAEMPLARRLVASPFFAREPEVDLIEWYLSKLEEIPEEERGTAPSAISLWTRLGQIMCEFGPGDLIQFFLDREKGRMWRSGVVYRINYPMFSRECGHLNIMLAKLVQQDTGLVTDKIMDILPWHQPKLVAYAGRKVSEILSNPPLKKLPSEESRKVS